jgi:hypothetical protein
MTIGNSRAACSEKLLSSTPPPFNVSLCTAIQESPLPPHKGPCLVLRPSSGEAQCISLTVEIHCLPESKRVLPPIHFHWRSIEVQFRFRFNSAKWTSLAAAHILSQNKHDRGLFTLPFQVTAPVNWASQLFFVFPSISSPISKTLPRGFSLLMSMFDNRVSVSANWNFSF